MTDRAGRNSAAAWGVNGWVSGVLVLLVALPLVAGSRLPDRLATHWDADSGRPDSSMPLWAASLFPALIWAVAAVTVALVAGPDPVATMPPNVSVAVKLIWKLPL